MKHIIDIDTWERRDNYNFFRTFHNSWISITSEVECGEALAAAKACTGILQKPTARTKRPAITITARIR